MASNSLIMGDKSTGTYTLNDPTRDVLSKGKYNKARVDNSGSSKSFYVVCDQTGYGAVQKERLAKSNVIPPDPVGNPGSCETVSLTYNIASCRGFDVHSPAIVLFEHANYLGNAKQFRSSDKDITDSFSTSDGWSGVSSFIVTGGKWKLYREKNFKGPLLRDLDKEKGGMYATAGLAANDKVMSIECYDQGV